MRLRLIFKTLLNVHINNIDLRLFFLLFIYKLFKFQIKEFNSTFNEKMFKFAINDFIKKYKLHN